MQTEKFLPLVRRALLLTTAIQRIIQNVTPGYRCHTGAFLMPFKIEMHGENLAMNYQ